MSYRRCRPRLCAFALSCALFACAREPAAPKPQPASVRDASMDAAPLALAPNEVQNPLVLDAGAALPPMAAAADAGEPHEPPLVLFLLDSSASMDWIDDCSCTTPACSECLPDCASGQRSRWLMMLEAVTGSFADFACELVPGAGASKHPQLAASTTQRDDGVIDRFAGRARFGFATFDSVRGDGKTSTAEVPLAQFDQLSSQGAAGMFSFGCVDGEACPRRRADGSIAGKLFYPGLGEPYLIDTGIRSAAANAGALILPRADEDASALAARTVSQLRAVLPFGGSPIAAAFDDLSIALADPTLPARRYVVLITDGPADDDYREFPVPGCACSTRAECGDDPAAMSCPYPLAPDAARRLRDSANVFVVALGSQDPVTRAALDAIAAVGGTQEAHSANGDQLAGVLDSVILSVTPQ